MVSSWGLRGFHGGNCFLSNIMEQQFVSRGIIIILNYSLKLIFGGIYDLLKTTRTGTGDIHIAVSITELKFPYV